MKLTTHLNILKDRNCGYRNTKPLYAKLIPKTALAILIRFRTKNAIITGGRIITNADQSRGMIADLLIWLRSPTPEERDVVSRCISYTNGIELKASAYH